MVKGRGTANYSSGHAPGGARSSSIASAAGRGQDQTRKNNACRAQRWAG